MGDVLRDAMTGIEGIDAAFIYGSVVRGSERGGSDVDLMVIGDPDGDALHRAVRKAERQLGREVNLAIMGAEEWQDRLASQDAFVQELLSTDKIFLTGDESALRTH
jgi:predicted nucleotidyltransferase